MSWQPNLRCTRCRESFHSAAPIAHLGNPCPRRRAFFGSCKGHLQFYPDYIESVERGWINDGIALAELYANHGNHRADTP